MSVDMTKNTQLVDSASIIHETTLLNIYVDNVHMEHGPAMSAYSSCVLYTRCIKIIRKCCSIHMFNIRPRLIGICCSWIVWWPFVLRSLDAHERSLETQTCIPNNGKWQVPKLLTQTAGFVPIFRALCIRQNASNHNS